jgi:hypothetical protein
MKYCPNCKGATTVRTHTVDIGIALIINAYCNLCNCMIYATTEPINHKNKRGTNGKMQTKDGNFQQGLRVLPSDKIMEQGQDSRVQGQKTIQCSICGNSRECTGDPMCVECRTSYRDKYI